MEIESVSSNLVGGHDKEEGRLKVVSGESVGV